MPFNTYKATFGPRSERASDELSVLRDLNNLITPHSGTDHASYFHKICKKLFLRKQDNIFDDIRAGNCDEEEIRGYAAIIWSTIAGTKDKLELSDITHRLQALNHDPDHGEELFMLLDEGCDGRVTRDELEKLVVNTASMLKKRAAAMRGIQLLLRKLELLLTIFVFGTIVFIYSESITASFVRYQGTHANTAQQFSSRNNGPKTSEPSGPVLLPYLSHSKRQLPKW